MGCGIEVYCKTCKQRAYVGYGSYGTWIFAETLADFDRQVRDDLMERAKNKNMRAFLEQHDGHEVGYVNYDCQTERNGVLYTDGGYGPDTVTIPDFGDYKVVEIIVQTDTPPPGTDPAA